MLDDQLLAISTRYAGNKCANTDNLNKKYILIRKDIVVIMNMILDIENSFVDKTHTDYVVWLENNFLEHEKMSKITNPKQIIFQPDLKTTVVIWRDDSKTIVKCSGEEDFIPEVGFAMALVKKIFPNRSEFLRMIDKAYKQPVRNKRGKEKLVENLLIANTPNV